MYKKASQLKLRFSTDLGNLTTEQLWDLPQPKLASILKNLRKTMTISEKDEELSFLQSSSKETKADIENRLRFDILKDIYLTNKEQIEKLRNEAEVKAHNQKIDALIAEKKDGQLRDLQIEELEKLRK